MPRPYQMAQRKAAGEKTRERILEAARQLLLAENFSGFTMDAVAGAADVSRLTVYYQFDSKAKLLEALYDYLAHRGRMDRLAEIFGKGNDALVFLHDFVKVFARFWATDRVVIRRLHGLGAIDPEVGKGLRARNERRRKALDVLLTRYERMYHPRADAARPIALDTLHMITSFETFDDLAVPGRSFDEVVEILVKLADNAVGFFSHFIRPSF